MQKITYRFFRTMAVRAVLACFLFLLLFSCRKKEVTHNPPEIKFVTDSGYVSHDTTLVAGGKIRIAIKAWGTDANITYFSIRYNDGTPKIILDTGMNRSGLNYTVDIIKTASQVEKWTFVVMDRNRQVESAGIVLTKSDYSKWGKIKTQPDILLGAQENPDSGSFYSLSSGRVFSLSEAYLEQAEVDMIYYYGQYQGTLSSPAEAEAPGFFTGPRGIANWTIKNEMRYDTTSLQAADFDLAQNDSLLLGAYDPAAGKKKGKFLQPGMVLSFKSPAGKLGLIKVTGLTGTVAGTLQFSVKIQE
ncbi:MAG: hypothetical protein WCK34_09575 [Bacteroidota bacterium]